MCVVSNIGDSWAKGPLIPTPYPTPNSVPPSYTPASKQEVEELRKEMQELKKLLVAAKKYDEATGQPDCEVEEKVALIKRFAKMVGVDMSDVFGEGESGGAS